MAFNARRIETSRLNQTEVQYLEKLVEFLSAVGAQEIRHSDADLLTHLLNTYGILRRWNCSEELCIAGLFHSIYGTETFTTTTVPWEKRQLVREVIGVPAEHLAYLYCMGVRRSLYENLDHEEPYTIRSAHGGSEITITRVCLADLLTLDLANTIEQLPRISLTGEMIEGDRSLYEKAVAYLPSAAVADMRVA